MQIKLSANVRKFEDLGVGKCENLGRLEIQNMELLGVGKLQSREDPKLKYFWIEQFES